MEYYDVLNQLAKGGQGTTLRVRRKQDKSVLVLKQSFCDDAKSGNDALREAKTLQGLEHPSIVRYEDVFLTEDGRQLVVCLIMAYMEGGDLARYMITVKKHGMTVEPNRVVLWTKQLAGAIAYLHTNKIVHRDLKPQNVFMEDDNNLKVFAPGCRIIHRSIHAIRGFQLVKRCSVVCCTSLSAEKKNIKHH
jgi:serine/threonine protein kinase